MKDFNIDDYLSYSEKKKIVEEYFKDFLKTKFKSEDDFGRVISNEAYGMVYRMVDKVFNKDLENILKEKIRDIILNITQFSIFKEPDAWGREPNNAYKFKQKCIEENFPRIKQIVNDSIDKETLKACKENINDLIKESIIEIYKEI